MFYLSSSSLIFDFTTSGLPTIFCRASRFSLLANLGFLAYISHLNLRGGRIVRVKEFFVCLRVRISRGCRIVGLQIIGLSFVVICP